LPKQGASGSNGPKVMRVVGTLLPDEDRQLLEEAIYEAPKWVLARRAPILLHGQHPEDEFDPADERLDKKLSLLQKNKLKRYVFPLKTSAGMRVVKIGEITTFGNALQGLLGQSISRKEHAYQEQAQALGVAATSSQGYLELREGPRLIRSANIQKPLPKAWPLLDDVFAKEYEKHGLAALEPLAECIADIHKKKFFHADLKGFHAYISKLDELENAPAQYECLWIDLARCGFNLSHRQRIINLYQTLRFIVPMEEEPQKVFIKAYCKAAQWQENASDKIYQKVQKFLTYKLRTHPNALA